MHTLLALLLFVVVFVVPNQVIAEDDLREGEEKRQVSVLARDGHLPYAGKRYVGDRMPESGYQQDTWGSNNEPSVFLMKNKRYVGALAKSGDLSRFKQQSDKRDEVDTLIDELLTAEELRRIRLESLREELMRQEDEDGEEFEADKRSLASLARSRSNPFPEEKRSISSMARAGFLRSPSSYLPEEEKRGISSLARSGLLPSFGKRGGVSSIMRNGYPLHKRSFDSDLDSLFLDEYDGEDKRNVASLARGFSLPSMGKRNIAAFARNGWLQDMRASSKRSTFEDWGDDEFDETKRNLPSLLRNRGSSLTAGKRYLGAFVANNRLPYSRQNFDDSKRNVGAMARNRNLPEAYRYGKRDQLYDTGDDGVEDLAKRYVSSLLKQGPLPVLSDNVDTNSGDTQSFTGEQQSKDENPEEMGEQKRHVGSLLAHKSFAMRKKKSISAEDQFGDRAPTTSIPLKSRSDENKMNNDIGQNQRQKREAFADLATASDEYPMPVLQNTDISEYDEGGTRSGSEETTRKKRYFAVRGGGKIPGGRLPHVGRSRSNNPNSGRRRGHYQQ